MVASVTHLFSTTEHVDINLKLKFLEGVVTKSYLSFDNCVLLVHWASSTAGFSGKVLSCIFPHVLCLACIIFAIVVLARALGTTACRDAG
jgi:hypothetical protein